MSEENKNYGHRFEDGHPRYGGRRRSSVAHAKALAEELGVEPLRMLFEICRDGSITKTVVENGRRKRVTEPVDSAMIVDILKFTSRFLHPTLSATQVKADVGVELDAQIAFPIDTILANPKLSDALSEVALMIAEVGADGKPRELLIGPDASRVMGD